MKQNTSIIKGVHPGAILERELASRNLRKGKFALSINEYPQTLVAVIKGKRRINPSLSLKLEQALGFEEGYFIVLQAYYDIKQEKLKHRSTPDISKFREVVFWDTDINKIDWEAYKVSVIKRVFERGNKQEQEEIIKFYGTEAVNDVLNKSAINNEKIIL